ncbi:MAG: hypothetical protein ACLFWM_05530 [Actinomycetota bacterium]
MHRHVASGRSADAGDRYGAGRLSRWAARSAGSPDRDIGTLRHLPPRQRAGDADQRRLLERYIDAFERHIDRLVTLLTEDAVMSMPPVPWWLRGGEATGALMRSSDACRGDRMVLTGANGQPALAQYRADGDRHRGFALVVVGGTGGLVSETTTYLEAGRLFPQFGLPLLRTCAG